MDAAKGLSTCVPLYGHVAPARVGAVAWACYTAQLCVERAMCSV